MKKIIILIILIKLLWLFMFCHLAWGERSYTPKEVVASTICAEAVGEGFIGLYAVSNVIANRSKKYNKSPYEVVTQKNQFYGYTAKNREELYRQGKVFCDYFAENLLKLDDITNGAIYFRRIGEKKRSWHLIRTIKIGRHIFYK